MSQQNKDKPTATSVNYSSQQQAITSPQLLSQTTNSSSLVDTATTASKISQQQQKLLTNKVKSDINSPIPQHSSKFEFEQTNRSKFDARDLDTITPVYHNRGMYTFKNKHVFMTRRFFCSFIESFMCN